MPLSLPLPTLDPAVLNVVPRFSFPLNSSCQMNEHDWMVPRIDNNFMPFVVSVACSIALVAPLARTVRDEAADDFKLGFARQAACPDQFKFDTVYYYYESQFLK